MDGHIFFVHWQSVAPCASLTATGQLGCISIQTIPPHMRLRLYTGPVTWGLPILLTETNLGKLIVLVCKTVYKVHLICSNSNFV